MEITGICKGKSLTIKHLTVEVFTGYTLGYDNEVLSALDWDGEWGAQWDELWEEKWNEEYI